MTKRILLIFTLLVSLTAIAKDYDFCVDGIYYKIIDPTNHTVEVTCKEVRKATKSYIGAINIPSSIKYKGKDYSVTSIGKYAFAWCKNLTSVTIPNSVTKIGEAAFHSCGNLTSVTIPNSVTSIGASAFGWCDNLTSVTIPNSVTTIGSSAFYACNKLTSVDIPNSITEIGGEAFRACNNLKSITIPNSVTEIGYWAFMDCSRLTSVTIPQSVAIVGVRAFADCKNMISVSILNPVTAIGEYAFANCNNLQYVNVPKGTPATAASVKYFTAAGKQDLITYVDMPEASDVQPQRQNEMAQAVPQKTQQPKKEVVASASEVDANIPSGTKRRDRTFALVIGNENYKREIAVPHAANDANVLGQYLTTTYGLPAENVTVITDATRNEIIDQLDWLAKVSNAFKGDCDVIVYYSGHGMPDEKTQGAMLIPVDGNSTNPVTCLPMEQIYTQLADMQVKNVTVLLDACFSGAQRGDGMLMAARGVVVKPKANALSGNMVVLAATQGDETAFPYSEKSHGMFTYYLLKKMQDSKGKATLGELYDYVNEQVGQRSILVNKKPQTPSVATSPSLTNSWRTLAW